MRLYLPIPSYMRLYLSLPLIYVWHRCTPICPTARGPQTDPPTHTSCATKNKVEVVGRGRGRGRGRWVQGQPQKNRQQQQQQAPQTNQQQKQQQQQQKQHPPLCLYCLHPHPPRWVTAPPSSVFLTSSTEEICCGPRGWAWIAPI
jgi:hypothetical protein